LDAATGDGDHGVTMNQIADAIINATAAPANPGIGPLLDQIGWDVMSVDGGSISALLGSFFTGMAEAVPNDTALDGQRLAAAFEGGLAKLRAQTPAQPGDKTMLDALLPAVTALRQAVDAQQPLPAILTAAAAAAQHGADSTKDMQARFGRARNLGARTIGHVDPGATTISLLFAGFAEAAT